MFLVVTGLRLYLSSQSWSGESDGKLKEKFNVLTVCFRFSEIGLMFF